jgi:hypothetical protein
MSRNKIVVVISGVCLLLAAGISWAASDYPRKPITPSTGWSWTRFAP